MQQHTALESQTDFVAEIGIAYKISHQELLCVSEKKSTAGQLL